MAQYTAGRMSSKLRKTWIIILTLVIALMLNLFPLPNWAEPFKPDWVALALIFWCMNMPGHVGLGTCFIFGVVLDIAMGTLLGQHAIGLVIIAFIVLKNHQTLRLFPLIQQGVIVMLMLLIKQLIFLWIYGMTNRAPETLWLYFMSSLVSMVLWPWFYTIMYDIQRRFTPIHG